MEEQKLKYYRLAKYPTYEILMDGQLASAGAHQARLIEKFKKNKKYIKNQFLALKFIFAILLLFIPLLPLVSYLQLFGYLEDGTYTINTILFISSFVFGIYFAMTFLYMILFGMVSTSSFMSGNSFKWLQTLPFSKKDLKRLGLMTLFRNLDIPIIILFLGFPIIMLIGTQNLLIFSISLLISFLNVVFNFSLLIILGEKLSFLFSESKDKSKRVNIVRIVTMLGYFIIAFGSGFVMSWGFQSIDTFLKIFETNEPSITVNIVLSLILFPFTSGYLLSLSIKPDQVPIEILFSTLIGYVLFILVTLYLYRTARRALRSTISAEIIVETAEKKEVQVEIKPLSTIEITNIEGMLILWSIVLLIYLFIPPMLIVGFLNLEESGSSTVSSLPIIPRDQAKAKIVLMFSIQGISLIFTSIMLTIFTNSVFVIPLFLVSLPFAWILLLFMFEMKIKLFGRMKYKYILEELQKKHKITKWISMILSEFAIYFVILTTGTILFISFDIIPTLITLFIIGVSGLSILIFVFTRMFPKVEKMAEYKTGGFLREHVNVGTLVLLILYFIFLFLPGFIIGPLAPFLLDIPTVFSLFIQFFIIVGFLILLWQIIVPYGLKLPNEDMKFIEHARSIGLSRVKPLWRNFAIGLGSIALFGLSTVLLGELLGTYYVIPEILFIGFNWFLFVLMLIPGIWEEVAFRGVILNLQRRKYSKLTVVFLNGILFGLFHFVNLLVTQDLFLTSLQVIYASCLGISFAYMFIKTNSLLPSILVHYLIDSVGQFFLTIEIQNRVNLALFAIFGVGVIPMVLIMILVWLLVANDTRPINPI
jgi:membrane protease YdiL (CAAX protease family)